MEREQAIKLMQDLLKRLVDRQGSDLFITSGFPPAIKVDGEIRPQSERVLTPEQSAVLVRSIMNDKQTREFDASKECNFAIAPAGIGRFRVSAFVQQGLIGCVVRTINAKIPTLEDMQLPPILKDIVMTKRGLCIIVGGTGLYYRALVRGLFPGPGADVEMRSRLEAIAGRRGVEFLHRILCRVDPESAHRIQPRDLKRMVRALEVFFLNLERP